MTIRMQELKGMTLEEVLEYVPSTQKLPIDAEELVALYVLVERALKNQHYRKLKKSDGGAVRRFLVPVGD